MGKGVAEADYVFEHTFRTHMTQRGEIEPHSVIAQIMPSGVRFEELPLTQEKVFAGLSAAMRGAAGRD